MDFYRRNELPETVKRYKTYTDQFQQWLVKTAVQRGAEWAVHVADQAKKAKGKKPYKIPIEQQERLVDAITKTNDPLNDTSGLLDLGDAIRSRKEVTQYYKINETSDGGHVYFNGSLEGFMASLKSLMPVLYKEQDLEDEPPKFLIVRFSQDKPDKDDDDDNDDDNDDEEAGIDESGQPGSPQVQHKSGKDYKSPSKTKSDDKFLTEEEQELQREFQVLCFLYNFNRIRGIVRDVWLLYHNGAVNAITAALVTDLAQSHIQQDVAALMENLGTPQGSLPNIVQKLLEKMIANAKSSQQSSKKAHLSDQVLRHILCIDAVNHMEAYFTANRATMGDPSKESLPEHPLMLFLRFFDVIRQNKLKLPIWDKFTEVMLLHRNTARDWLPFGLQIILDIKEVMCNDYRRIFRDITEHGLDISRLVQSHVDYEDHMWGIGKKPEYMTKQEVKFSTVFLDPLDTLLAWIQALLKTNGAPAAQSNMTTDVFVTVHTTLAGLAMWHFNKLYHSTAISKVQWFITCLSHLYNAAQQIGGLELAWPDLDFIIEMHGSQRIFLGDPPTDPNDFLERYWLAFNVSSRFMAADFRHIRGKYLPHAPREVREKRGLMSHFPLEETLKAYHGSNPKYDRWLKRHNIFNYLHRQKEASETSDTDESEEDQIRLKKLRAAFTSMAAEITPRKPKNRRKNPPRVRTPDFSQMDDTYAGLFVGMRDELQAHELHSNFDYLSFYRRVFDFILRIRNEVLFDTEVQMASRSNIHKNPNQTNRVLLAELFRGLKTKPKEKNIETTGEEVSTQVVPLDQLKRIAKMMGDLIQEKGSVELMRAKFRLGRNWDELKASYAAEEAEQREAAAESTDPLHAENEDEDNQEPDSSSAAGDPDIDRDYHSGPVHSKVVSPEHDAFEEVVEEDLSPPTVSHYDHDVSAQVDIAGEYKNDKADESSDFDPSDAEQGCQVSNDENLVEHTKVDTTAGLRADSDEVYVDTEELTTEQVNATGSVEHIKGVDTERLSSDLFIRVPYQAYVSNEADEANSWATDLQSHLDAIRHEEKKTSDTMDCDEILDVINDEKELVVVVEEDQHHVDENDEVEIIDQKPGRIAPIEGDEHGIDSTVPANASSKARIPENVEPDLHVDDDFVSQPLPVVEHDEQVEQQEKESIIEETKSVVPVYDTKTVKQAGVHTAPKVTSMWLYDELFQAADHAKAHEPVISYPAQKPKHEGRPSGIFHRLTFSSTASRKRSVTIKRTSTSPRLAFSRPRKGKHHHHAGIAGKHAVSMPCYALCSLSRALLGVETKFQRRVKQAAEILQARKSRRDSLDLEEAWGVASEEDGVWESE